MRTVPIVKPRFMTHDIYVNDEGNLVSVTVSKEVIFSDDFKSIKCIKDIERSEDIILHIDKVQKYNKLHENEI
jgi:hypothetical protein